MRKKIEDILSLPPWEKDLLTSKRYDDTWRIASRWRVRRKDKQWWVERAATWATGPPLWQPYDSSSGCHKAENLYKLLQTTIK